MNPESTDISPRGPPDREVKKGKPVGSTDAAGVAADGNDKTDGAKGTIVIPSVILPTESTP